MVVSEFHKSTLQMSYLSGFISITLSGIKIIFWLTLFFSLPFFIGIATLAEAKKDEILIGTNLSAKPDNRETDQLLMKKGDS